MAGAPIDDSAQHRLKAEACRRLADAEEDPYRKARWMERADYWERLAAKAAKLSQQRKPPDSPKPQNKKSPALSEARLEKLFRETGELKHASPVINPC
jgi:hypothetical protein